MIPHTMRRSALVLGLSLAFSVLCGVDQARAGEIVGVARDSSGGVLPSARILLHNNATAADTVVVAGADGGFKFEGLPAGIYSLTASFDGFSEDARTVTLAGIDQTVEVAFALHPGAVAVDVTVTATRGERDSLLVPLRTDTLTRDQVSRVSPTSTGDALTLMPGITPVGSGPFEVRPRLRGLDSTRVLVLVDGERLNNARTATDRSGTEVGLVDLSTLSSAEVVSGSGSVLYGTDALSGTVNLVTTDIQFADAFKMRYGFDGFYSSNEDGHRGTATIGMRSRRLAVNFAATLEDYGNYHAGSPAAEDTRPYFASGVLKQADTIDDAFHLNLNAFPDPFNAPFVRTSSTIPASGGRGSNINAAALVALSGTQTIQVKYIQRRMENVGFADFAEPTFFQQVSLPYSNLGRFSARYEARGLSSWFTNLRISTYYQDQDRLLRNEFPVQFPVPSPTFFPINVFRLQILSDTEQRVKTPGLDAQATMLLAGKHVVTLGTTIYADRSRDQRTTATQTTIVGDVEIGPYGPQASVFGTPLILGSPAVSHPVRVPDATFRDIGFFVQDEWDARRYLHIVGGLRADSYEVTTAPTPGYSVDSVVAGASPSIDPNDLPNTNGDRLSHTALTGEIGAILRTSEHVSVLARYGRSYRHPNLEELLFAGPATVGSIAPNLTVGPETGNNIDVGIKARATRYAASLTYFNNTYHGFISTEIVASTPAGPLSQAVNFADVRIQGIEGTGELPLRLGAGLLTLTGSLAYTRGDVLRGANPLTGTSLAGTPQDNITPLKLMPGVRYSDDHDRFWVEYGARIETQVNRVAQTRLESPYLIAQDLLSLNGFAVQRVAWGINVRQRSSRLGVVFALDNLANRFYREQFQFAPARGRTFSVALNIRGN